MATKPPKHVLYAQALSEYEPRIALSRAPEEVMGQATDFLHQANGWLDVKSEKTFYEETAYLWATFPPREKTLECYQNMVQILLAQLVDTAWYFDYPQYSSDDDVASDDTLLSFRRSGADFEAQFVYVQYYGHVLMRVPNSLRLRYRRLTNHPGRYTQGLTITRCKMAMAGLINQISEDVAGEVNAKRPFKLLVNSLLRTADYQESLARLGYVAPRHSAHLAGYAVDLERFWYEKHDRLAYGAIEKTLNDLFQQGIINLIEEETHWHICLNPSHIPNYEKLAQKWLRKRG